MAQEFYLLATASGVASPVTGRITQLVQAIDAGSTVVLSVDSTALLTLTGTGTSDVGFVVPLNIPVKMGQKVACSTRNGLVTVTGQGS